MEIENILLPGDWRRQRNTDECNWRLHLAGISQDHIGAFAVSEYTPYKFEY